MPRKASSVRSERPLSALIASLTREELAEIVTTAVDRHEDVVRAVRLVAGRAQDDLSVLRREVDGALRTRRFLDYRESIDWAEAAQPVVAELELLVQTAPSPKLIGLVERAIGHVVRVLSHADDSAGAVGGLARELLELHVDACEAGMADPIELAAWMARFAFVDQDFFEPDPVRYARALGQRGLAEYREAVANAPAPDSFAVRYARERLAIVDQDLEAIVELVGGDLSHAHQFARVAEAMAELGRDDLVLDWAGRGIRETAGWQIGRLYDLACETHTRRGEPLEALRLRRDHHERTPSFSTYAALRGAAEVIDAWHVECDGARAVLERHDPRGYVYALLADGDAQLAWDVATSPASLDALDGDDWLRLAEVREPVRPDEALAVYQRVADEMLVRADVRTYRKATKILKRARSAAVAAARPDLFDSYVRRIREQYRRRPSLIAMLDRAGLA
jgi:hypothetical protein